MSLPLLLGPQCADCSHVLILKKPIVALTHLPTTGRLTDGENRKWKVFRPSPNTSLFHSFATSAIPITKSKISWHNAVSETLENKLHTLSHTHRHTQMPLLSLCLSLTHTDTHSALPSLRCCSQHKEQIQVFLTFWCHRKVHHVRVHYIQRRAPDHTAWSHGICLVKFRH